MTSSEAKEPFATPPRRWPWILTGAVTVGVVGVGVYVRTLSDLNHIGGILAGYASAVAFIWLIAAYVQQGYELKLQREELSLQRQALEHQRVELKKMGKYAALQQVAQILHQFEQSLSNNPQGRPRSVTELPAAFING